MSIMRSFTTRRKPDLDDTPGFVGRAASQRGGRPVARGLISAPVELVSTTNMLSYNAPNIAGTKPIEHRDIISNSSSEESDGNSSVHSRETDPTDLSSTESSPIATGPHHLSHFFKSGNDDIASTATSPMLPTRAPSHSKHAHEALSRQRSVQRAKSPAAPGRTVSRARSSAAMFNSAQGSLESQNPFGKELAQLDAVAEEFGGIRTEAESDAMWIQSRGLACYAASDYLTEIDGLVNIFMDDRSPTVPDFSGWF